MVVLAIGCNRTQFASEEDYGRFPRNITADLEWVRDSSDLFDAVLLAKPHELFKYGPEHGARVRLESEILPVAYVNVGVLEGEATTLVKLVNIVRPTRLYLGDRDVIKTTILRRIIDDLHLPIAVLTLPTVRQENGVAWDSRLSLLPPSTVDSLEVVYCALRLMVAAYLADEFDTAKLVQIARNALEGRPELQIDFVRVAHPFGFQDIVRVEPAVGAVAIISVCIQNTVHQDNVILAPTVPQDEQTLWGLMRSAVSK